MCSVKLALVAALAAPVLSVPAEARIFKPQPAWTTSGQTCAATRKPPAQRWRALPPRSCTQAKR